MEVKVASTSFQLLQALASAISSPSSKRRFDGAWNGMLMCRSMQRIDRRCLFGVPSSSPLNLNRTRSCGRRARSVRRACSASLDAFSDEEFAKEMQELALRFLHADDERDTSNSNGLDSESEIPPGYGSDSLSEDFLNLSHFPQNYTESSWDEIRQERPDWLSVPASVERKANSVDLPLSLRMMKRKMQWQEGFREAGESACCSVEKAFSSTVFIISELHRCSIQMREILSTEDLQGVLVRVQKELHDSFVWLFQQVFSHTPTLMMSVMILLANFSVYSMGSNVAIAVSPPLASYSATSESVSVVEIHDQRNQKFDSSSLKKFLSSSSGGKSTSIRGNNGGGGKVRPISNGTDDGGDGRFDPSDQFRRVVPEGASQLSSSGTTHEAESVSEHANREDELQLWNSIVDEASRMHFSSRHEYLDHETMQRLVSPVSVKIEPDDNEDYVRTNLLYQTALSEEPNSSLLLANYAQFLYLVTRNYDRAEECFKRAIEGQPCDAEAYIKYASFLWRVKNDLWAAEEAFLEAISTDPTNSSHAASYAHFLWNTGNDDACFPISS